MKVIAGFSLRLTFTRDRTLRLTAGLIVSRIPFRIGGSTRVKILQRSRWVYRSGIGGGGGGGACSPPPLIP